MTPTDAMEDDRALVRAVLARSPRAFEQLVARYQGLCWHITLRMVRHPEDARDLCQETFFRVFRYLHQYRFDSALRSWIGQVAYAVAKRHLERKRIPIEEGSGDGDATPMDLVGDDFDLESSSADAQIHAMLHLHIDALPPLQRTLLTMYHLDELPIGDISHITGLPEGTVKSHLFRARKRLREQLERRRVTGP